MAIEEPLYGVHEKDGDLEIRDYPALVAAEVSVRGGRFEAATSGFRLLAAYIFGGNQRRRQINMPSCNTVAIDGRIDPNDGASNTNYGWRRSLGYTVDDAKFVYTVDPPYAK